MLDEMKKERGENISSSFSNSSYDLVQTFNEALTCLIKNYRHGPDLNVESGIKVLEIMTEWYIELIRKPNRLWQEQIAFSQALADFWGETAAHFFSNPQKNDAPEYLEDKRFKGKLWHDLPLFQFYQQNYLFFEKQWLAFVEKNPSSHPKITQQIHFFSQQFINAMSPANFVLTNPEVLSETITSNGENLLRGFRHFLEDIIQGQGHWNVKMTDNQAFEVGKNIAKTPGKVIYQNKMIELIQFSPTTPTTHERPLLIIPPWINKYYILDLSEKNSYIQWIVNQGVSVFVISWINPDKHYRDTAFEDYLFEGVFKALDTIGCVSTVPEVNALGFCIGGTLLAVALAYMKAKNDTRIVSATFLATLVDFSDPGAMAAFVDEKQIETVSKRMEIEGFLDGRLLRTAFNILRSNDLLWSFYVHNYLQGKEPFAFDLLFWNCDSTNLPMKMHSEYLHYFYLHNLLTQHKLILRDVKLDLSVVEIPTYFVATEQDHIVPWKSCFEGARYFGGDVSFILGGSGHISGIINPPSHHKYSFYYTEKTANQFQDSHQWLTHAQRQEGSWWEHWGHWLERYSGDLQKALDPKQGCLPILRDAPGEYVLRRIF